MTVGQFCTDDLRQECMERQCEPCFSPNGDPTVDYNCSLPGLTSLTPGQYEGVTVNYLSFVTDTSSPNLPIRAREFEACTGGSIVFSEAANVWEDPITDLGTKTSRGTEFYDGYFMSYSHFPEASALDLAEHLNDRIRADNDRLKWEDVLPKVKAMGTYRKNGKTNVDFLMYDGDFFVPVIRLDLLEKHNLPLPHTWPEVVEYAKFFNNTDLNGDGEMDYGFCHFPRGGAGNWDWWASEIFYSIWATFDQTHGMNQGFFFDEDTMEPRVNSPGFEEAAKIWKDLWTHGADGCGDNFISGRCAIGFAPPGCLKGIFLNPDGVSRKDENGTVVWQPTMRSGEYAEPLRIKPFGTTQVVDRSTGKLTNCTPSICPKAEACPLADVFDRHSMLPPSPLEGKLANRAPFYWSGGLGTLIRKSATEVNKDLMWDFFVYTNSPQTSVYDVANYESWLDSWRYSQLLPGKNFIEAGWSRTAYEEHAAVMQWALGNDVNGALNLRVPGMAKYTRDVIGTNMAKYINGAIGFTQFVNDVTKGWNDITLQQGKLDQLEIYRAGLGLDAHSEVELCRLHRDLMDERDPSICRQYDEEVDNKTMTLVAILIPSLIAIFAIITLYFTDKKRRAADKLWTIKLDELSFQDPPQVLGRGSFGLVVLAEYRGTPAAVKRAIPPKENSAAKNRNSILGSGSHWQDDLPKKWKSNGSSQQKKRRASYSKMEHALEPVKEHFWEEENARDEESGSPLSLDTYTCTKSAHDKSSSLGDNSNGSGGTPAKRRRFFGRCRRRGDEYTDFVAEMRHLSRLRHSCITTVMGAVIDKGQEPMLVMEFLYHGSLYDILHNKSIPLDGAVLLPILQDIAQGARFLHAADPPVIHGDLKSQNVLIDARLRAKVTDFGLSAKKRSGARGSPQWMAPELVRRETTNTAASDVYSFGILLWECYSRATPYEGEEIDEVLRDVADPKIEKRPAVPPACPPKLASIMPDCLEGDPELRPRFEEIDLRLKRLDNIDAEPDEMLLPPWNRQNFVGSRDAALLSGSFPQHVAEELLDGQKVEPEQYDCVTIFLSEVVGFADIVETQTPEQVSDMLKRLYLSFDELCKKHDVFKVETVGETYMCVTNMVKDQEEDHSLRIAEFSADAIQAASQTPVNTEDESLGYLQIRVGFHSGPVISRVVGSQCPKFCIFGDAVNTVAMMESNSLPGRAQCTQASANLLRKQCPEIDMQPRGNISVKGKGEMGTFFLPLELFSLQ